MRIDAARLVYFTATGTTRAIVEGIAGGLGLDAIEALDLLRPGERSGDGLSSQALTVIGSPVYSGRLPAEAASRLRRLRGDGQPAVLVVVYGNRAYEDALLELSHLARESGFVPVAAAAFVGEHSFSSPTTPIAVGRPDADDLGRARAFGRAVAEKLAELPDLTAMPPLSVPGRFPYRASGLSGGVSPETREADCQQCGQCAAACPVGAVRLEDGGVVTDKARCLRCCACVKGCPTGARLLEDPGLLAIAQRLAATCRERKEPEVFL